MTLANDFPYVWTIGLLTADLILGFGAVIMRDRAAVAVRDVRNVPGTHAESG